MGLNEKVIEYQETGNDLLFSEIYHQVFKGSARLIETLSQRYNLDVLDVESLINEKIYEVVLSYTQRGEFLNAVRQAIRFGCIDLARKYERIREHEVDPMVYDEIEGEYTEVFEVTAVAPTTGEAEIIKEIQKSLDQRQLIEALLRNADDTVYETISAFQMTDSYREAAKLTNTCHKTVKNRIKRISSVFSEDSYGSYHDYFTVPTTRVG